MSGRVDLVIASAGTGKTTRLAQELVDRVTEGTSPENVVATTFTNAAADELIEKGRERLLTPDQPVAALRLLLGRVGTVNSVFGSLLAEMALAAGRSPVAQVIPDSAQKALFRVAADDAIGSHADQMNGLARRFAHETSNTDWRDAVRAIVNAARVNGIPPTALASCAAESWRTLRAALPSPAPSGEALDGALRDAVRNALERIGNGDGTNVTSKAVAGLQEAERSLDGFQPAQWPLWCRLAKLNAGTASDLFMHPVREAAAQHPRHPRLHADLKAYIDGVFGCAAEAFEAFQNFKMARGLVDFADQEVEALKLLQRTDIAQRLAGELELLLVDEFQDTSPIQLALFLSLVRLVSRALWVGDPKQAIYGFRGSDPALVQAVAASLPSATGGATETLKVTYRSRPAIVALTNDAFGAAFPPLGIDHDQVIVEGKRPDAPGQGAALGVWRLSARNQDEEARAVAIGVRDLLEEAASWPVVVPRGANEIRPLQGCDIVVLCRTNEGAGRIAEALEAVGLKVALGRAGLFSRAECVLAVASLRYAVDPSDTIALAEIAHVLADDADSPAWLAETVAAAATAVDDMAAREAARAALVNAAPASTSLASLRNRLPSLTPREALDAAIAALDVPVRVYQWGSPAARFANLEALRGLAAEYEDECRRERLPATPGGLVAWLADRPDAEEPPSPDPEAVQVSTVHRAKGLEWPMVILAEMDKEPRPRLFDQPVAMPAEGEFDPFNPLSGRWLRFWPWPYGESFGRRPTNVHLDTSILATPMGRIAVTQASAEEARLLYVATTRARDYLIFAPRLKTTKAGDMLEAAWLDGLHDAAGSPALSLPTTGTTIRAGGRDHSCAVRDISVVENLGHAERELTGPVLPQGTAPDFPPARLYASALQGASPVTPLVAPLGPRLPLVSDTDITATGEALHSLFAADRPAATRSERLALASAILTRWRIAGLLAEDALLAADRLWGYIEARWPDATVRREVPVFHHLGQQRRVGRVDLVVEHSHGLAVLDHKAFPGESEHWPARCGEYLPQLRAYAGALAAATGKHVTFIGLHLPVAGAILELPLN
jgi:ATP-dependent exoDNAse (exonuclease V) beta subunit